MTTILSVRKDGKVVRGVGTGRACRTAVSFFVFCVTGPPVTSGARVPEHVRRRPSDAGLAGHEAKCTKGKAGGEVGSGFSVATVPLGVGSPCRCSRPGVSVGVCPSACVCARGCATTDTNRLDG